MLSTIYSNQMHTYPCPHGRSSVSAMTSQHSVQQLSRMLTCFSKARRRCLGDTPKNIKVLLLTFIDTYLSCVFFFALKWHYRLAGCTCAVSSPYLMTFTQHFKTSSSSISKHFTLASYLLQMLMIDEVRNECSYRIFRYCKLHLPSLLKINNRVASVSFYLSRF